MIDFEPDFWDEVRFCRDFFFVLTSCQIYIFCISSMQIEESLEQFYLHCLLPELADPRFGCRGKTQILKDIENLNLKLRAPRGLPVREPHYIVEVSWSPGHPANQRESQVEWFCKIGSHLLEVDMMSLCCRRRT